MSDINKLRESLFATIEGVRAGTVDVEKAKVIGDLSQVIVNSAKVEVDYLKANGGGGISGFLSATPNKTPTPTGTLEKQGNSTIHRLR